MALQLGSLLDALSSAVVELVTAPSGLDVGLDDVVIHDPVSQPPIGPGDVVLAIGVAASGAEIETLVDRAGAAEAAALVVMSADDHVDAELVRRATAAGVALLRVGPHVAWGHLHTQIRTAFVAHAAIGDPSGPRGTVPLGDLFALANAIAATVGGATTIEDRQLHVLAHSNLGHPVDPVRLDSIVGRRVPDALRGRTAKLYQDLWRSDGIVRVPAHAGSGSRPRLGVAVRAGTEPIGTIWVVEGDRPFTAADEQALREAAQLTALHILRHTAGEDVERRRRGDLVRSVLEGRIPFDAVATELGVEQGLDVTVVALTLSANAVEAGRTPTARLIDRLIDVVTLHVESYRRTSAVAALGSVVYAIVADAPEAGAARRRQMIDAVVDRSTHALHEPVVAGVGSTVGDAAHLARSRDEADAALSIARRRPGPCVAHIDDVIVNVVIARVCERIRTDPDLTAGLLARLQAHDAEHRTDYVITVAAHLRALGNIGVAAASLFVHPNTMRYRLRRITESTGIDPDDQDTRFVLELELRAAALLD